MLEFAKVTMGDLPLLATFYEKNPSPNSTINLANMLMWKDALDLNYAVVDDVLYLDMHWEKDCRMLFAPLSLHPQTDRKQIMQPILQRYGHGCELIMRCLDEQQKHAIQTSFGDLFAFAEDRDNFDYVYNSADLLTYSGKKFHQKRNHINHLLQNYTPEYLPYDLSMLDECWQLYIRWYENKDSEATGMDYEPQATRFVMERYEQFAMQGCVVKLNGRIEAFAFGQQITPDMALIHVEKANARINGLYPYIAQQFVAHAYAHLPFINRMEDDGIEGLRKAKLSMRPVKFVEKYTMTLNYKF